MTELQFRIKAGLDVPITGAPASTIDAGAAVRSVGVLGPDYLGMKPRLKIAVDERVRLGQVLVEDKDNPAARLTSPGSGRMCAPSWSTSTTLRCCTNGSDSSTPMLRPRWNRAIDAG